MSTYNLKARRRDQQRQLRAAILEAALDAVAKNGPDGLSVRHLADAVGASTKVIYSHFGGKNGVIEALYAEGFARLAETMTAAAATVGNRRAAILAAARAYRSFAREQRHQFELMYGPWIRDLLPTPESRQAAWDALAVLVELYEPADDALARARTLWAAIHGPVALEAAAWFTDPEAEARFEAVLTRMLGEDFGGDNQPGN